MKKIFFVLLVIVAAYQASAQQQPSLKPADSLLLKLYKSPFQIKPADSSLYGKFFKLQPIVGYNNLKALPTIGNEEVFYSTMPVVRIGKAGRMPVVKPGDSKEKYMMLVKKYKVANPLLKEQPAIP